MCVSEKLEELEWGLRVLSRKDELGEEDRVEVERIVEELQELLE